MKEYKVVIDALFEAENEADAIVKFRQWVSETDASVFEVSKLKHQKTQYFTELCGHVKTCE